MTSIAPIIFKAPSEMWHVGTLDPKDKGNRGSSQEGLGLSFSDTPEEWVRIASLGGLPWWKAATDNLCFLDGYEFIEKNESKLEQWGVEHSLVELRLAYAFIYYDDELESEMEMLFSTLEEVSAQAGYMNIQEMQSDPSFNSFCVKRMQPWPTKLILERMGCPASDLNRPSVLAHEFLATLWAEDNSMDGVWWEVDHAPGEVPYSANRAVVFKGKTDKIKWVTPQVRNEKGFKL